MGVIGQGQYLGCGQAVSTFREINDGHTGMAHFKLCQANGIGDIQQSTEKSNAEVVVGKESNPLLIGLQNLIRTTFLDMLQLLSFFFE